MKDFGKILKRVIVTWIYSAIDNRWAVIDFTLSKVSVIFNFNVKAAKQIENGKNGLNIPENV